MVLLLSSMCNAVNIVCGIHMYIIMHSQCDAVEDIDYKHVGLDVVPLEIKKIQDRCKVE